MHKFFLHRNLEYLNPCCGCNLLGEDAGIDNRNCDGKSEYHGGKDRNSYLRNGTCNE